MILISCCTEDKYIITQNVVVFLELRHFYGDKHKNRRTHVFLHVKTTKINSDFTSKSAKFVSNEQNNNRQQLCRDLIKLVKLTKKKQLKINCLINEK